LEKLKSNPIPIPEGASYFIRVRYYVQRDIVTGLQYDHSVYRGPIRDNRTIQAKSALYSSNVDKIFSEKNTITFALAYELLKLSFKYVKNSYSDDNE
uniref:TonB-dependent receptor n=1 Tax=Echinostoma caproni TaxID=27848 RepID=A0A183AHA6_9TREM